MEDPNWFFSTLAQSAAAIVGLIGAFLVSRIVEQANEVRGKKKELLERISNLITKDLQNDIDKLMNLYSGVLDNLNGQLDQGGKPSYLGMALNLRTGVQIVVTTENSEKAMMDFKDVIESLGNVKRFLLCLTAEPFVTLKESPKCHPCFYDYLLKKDNICSMRYINTDQADSIDDYPNWNRSILEFVMKYDIIGKDYVNFKESFVLRSYLKYGPYILGFIAISCVIAPLFFLSAGSNLIAKIIFLVMFFIGVFVLLLFFKLQVDEIEKFLRF